MTYSKDKDDKIVFDEAINRINEYRKHFFEMYPSLKDLKEVGVTKNDFELFFIFYENSMMTTYINHPKDKDKIIERLKEVSIVAKEKRIEEKVGDKNMGQEIEEVDETMLFLKVLKVIFDSGFWKENTYFDAIEVQANIVFLLQFYTEEKYIPKIEKEQNLLEKINTSSTNTWKTNMSMFYTRKLENILEKGELDSERSVAFEIMNRTFALGAEEYAERFGKHKNKFITFDQLNTIYKEEILFWDMLTSRANTIIAPNKKYNEEMFKYTTDLIFEGKKQYVAFGKTLTIFGYNPLKNDSYRKAYKKYLKEK